LSISSSKIHELVESNLEEFISFRHHIHSHPELSFKEYETAKFISSLLTSWGISHQTGLAGTGIVANIEGKNPSSRVIALRADMDALPILEQNNVPYKSTHDGVMHACGHDVHSTCLLGTAKILQQTRDEWDGTVKLIFQPGKKNIQVGQAYS
jgi:amidohydrolase